MRRRIVIRPEAEGDLEEAYRWYEEQVPGLGSDFLLCFEEGLAKIERLPQGYPAVRKDIRRLLIRRFPYGIFYLLVEDSIIVLGVFHARRDPKQWATRT